MVDFEWYRSFISIYKYHSLSEASQIQNDDTARHESTFGLFGCRVGEPLVESLEEVTMGLKASSSSTIPAVRIGSAPEFFRERILPRLNQIDMKVIAYYSIASVVME